MPALEWSCRAAPAPESPPQLPGAPFPEALHVEPALAPVSRTAQVESLAAVSVAIFLVQAAHCAVTLGAVKRNRLDQIFGAVIAPGDIERARLGRPSLRRVAKHLALVQKCRWVTTGTFSEGALVQDYDQDDKKRCEDYDQDDTKRCDRECLSRRFPGWGPSGFVGPFLSFFTRGGPMSVFNSDEIVRTRGRDVDTTLKGSCFTTV